MEIYYINQLKKNRAEDTVRSPDFAGKQSVEFVLYNQGKEKKLEGDALVLYIYKGLGGVIAEGSVAKEASQLAKEAKKREGGAKAARERNKRGKKIVAKLKKK